MASFVKITGVSEILQKLDKANVKVEETLQKAIQKGAQPIKSEMETFISHHKYSGLTASSFIEEYKFIKGKLNVKVGYSVRKGGIAAIFLNIGTPKMAPSFFIDNAIYNNTGYMNKVIKDELLKLLGG